MRKPNNTKQMAIIAAVLIAGLGLLVALNKANEQAASTISVDAAESGGGHDHNGDGKPDHD